MSSEPHIAEVEQLKYNTYKDIFSYISKGKKIIRPSCIAKGLREFGIYVTPLTIEQAILCLDIDRDKIDFWSFFLIMETQYCPNNTWKAEVTTAFNYFDPQRYGRISTTTIKDTLLEYFNGVIPQSELNELLAFAKVDGAEDYIFLDDFMELLGISDIPELFGERALRNF